MRATKCEYFSTETEKVIYIFFLNLEKPTHLNLGTQGDLHNSNCQAPNKHLNKLINYRGFFKEYLN